ncbi:hypothetical protein SPRG_07529 [Saprolegnia parasitica CBS 223.65]|uniref:PX domain-containing protein n=1 Tax=Saprolegnia parasitica (strain CBS 223.65) TaxID=695850 RepID=A0A067CDP2_SAPPC|nr:hypothetical protein SPRG_07529 [Saprolegnia parasitica CBS 223.65]KDO27280.1 hypothetical protein SPRG_07529 [Saprolegnia parasitica CBS 223.65]|eukprot:XP_012202055.1 hypothetical protein SPRG_07529 [Saprolegnia parasitica CBS 223.65]
MAGRPVFLKPSIWSTRYGANFFTVNVESYVVKDNTFAAYALELKRGSTSWVVHRRYSEFATLWGQLYGLGDRLPTMPPKTYCFRDLSPDYLKTRQRLLEECIWQLLQIPGVSEIPAVVEFLELKA